MRLETGKKRQKEKNPSLKAREGWRWKAEPSRFVYHRYEFFSLRPSFFSLYQHDILISLKLREKFISPPPKNLFLHLPERVKLRAEKIDKSHARLITSKRVAR